MSGFLIGAGVFIFACAGITGLMGGDRGVIGPSILVSAGLICLGLFLQ